MRRITAFVIAATFALGFAGADSAPIDSTLGRFEGAGDSRRRYSDDRIWKRRRSIRELEGAAQRAPRDVATLDRLGNAYYDAGFLRLARVTFERAIAVDASAADAHFGLGRIREREWLDAPASITLKQAEQHFRNAVRARPTFHEAWVALAVLRFERRDPWTAREAAMTALQLSPHSVEAELAGAYLAYRTGLVALSDSLFTVSVPRCPPGIAARFSEITPLLTETEERDFAELNPRARVEYARRFWSRNDPDPTTPQNEARLEFWSRLAHALLLIGDPWSPHWVARTDLYSRYGRLVQIEREFDSEHTEMPHVEWGEVAVDPTPEALESLGQNTTTGGRAVFAPLPPGEIERPLESLISRFEGPRGARIAAMVETPGTPADSIIADCVVIDAEEREVARQRRELLPSACDPAERRAGEFAFELPPGRYRLAIAVHDAMGGRGLAHANHEIAPSPPSLTMSDLVLACGSAGAATTQGTILLNPNLSARVEGNQSLFAYFEVYHLGQDDGGANRFEYEYTVRDVGADASRSASRKGRTDRAAPRLRFSSTQEGVGPLRRQFIRVPAASLPDGRYRLTITVRDQLASATAERWVDFVKAMAER